MVFTRHTLFALPALLAAVLIAGCEGKAAPEPAPKPAPGPEGTLPKTAPKDPLTVAKESITAGTAVMVDVRSQDERDAGYLDGSIFLPITQIKEEAGKEGFSEWAAGKLPKGKVVYLH